jgi:hypothetical protein
MFPVQTEKQKRINFFLTKKINRENDPKDHEYELLNRFNTKTQSTAFELNRGKEKVSCNCKHSQCSKLYCECFSNLSYCDPNVCACKDCSNTIENKVINNFFIF